MTTIDSKAYRKTLLKVKRAIALRDRAEDLLQEAMDGDDVLYDCGASAFVALFLNGWDAEDITKRLFGIA